MSAGPPLGFTECSHGIHRSDPCGACRFVGPTQTQQPGGREETDDEEAEDIAMAGMKPLALLLCAWVLWGAMSPDGQPRQWDILFAAVDKAGCDAELRSRSRLMPDGLRGGERTATPWVLNYFCLPDTIDPRGPNR
jgi:hypothetical protein